MKIAIGCDHGGFELKQQVVDYLKDCGIDVEDCGCYDDKSCDYPKHAQAVAGKVVTNECEQGILICGTGIGMSIAANKITGIRAALCSDCFSAEATKLHNNANVLCMGARVLGAGLALKIVDTFVNTEFSNDERHIRRLHLIEE